MTDISPHALRTARHLFDINSVLFNAEKPFIFVSGRASPVYVDCRRIPSFVEPRRDIIRMGAQMLREQAGPDAFDLVAGGETAGIPYGAFMAEEMSLPMIYVRKQPKGHGRMAQIEGELREGQRVLLVEDLATDGGSKVRFCEALRNAGAIVEHIFVVFHYGIFEKSQKTMDELGVKLHALCTWWDMLATARLDQRFDPKTLDEVEAFLKDPVSWSRAHGGKED